MPNRIKPSVEVETRWRPTMQEYNNLRDEFRRMTECRNALHDENAKLRDTVANFEQRLAAARLQDVDGLRADVDKRVAEELARVTAERDRLRAEKAFPQATIDALHAKISQLEQQMVRARAELEQHRSAKSCDKCLEKGRDARMDQNADLRYAQAQVTGLADENRALRSQLALAEERRRPARHRPGDQRPVGWDPEGVDD